MESSLSELKFAVEVRSKAIYLKLEKTDSAYTLLLHHYEIWIIFDDADVLQGGVEGKRQVDKVIDSCAAMQVS